MKTIIRNALGGLLAVFARGVLRKYKPTVVMVTGSVGKTSTKDAIAAALAGSRFVRASEKNHNNELGVPFTIIGVKKLWSSKAKWLQIYSEAILLLLLRNHYPKVLVLEVGADRPGDLARILKIVTPDVVVVTKLPDVPVHVEAYTTPEAVREEEFAPAYALGHGCPLILSADDTYACELAKPLETAIISYGLAASASVRIATPKLWVEAGEPIGMQTEVTVGGVGYPLKVRGALGAPQLLAPAAALAVTHALGIPLKNALSSLEKYVPPSGRGRILKGKHESIIIDDTYNASPAAVEEALTTLSLAAAQIPGTRRVAVIGDMLELGRYSHEQHAHIGTLAIEHCDLLITVGPRARAIAETACAAGMPEAAVHSFDTAQEAALEVAAIVEVAAQGKDPLTPTPVVVLVKGSQSIRTEHVVEALLEDPADIKLLVRQESEWKRR